MRSSNFVKLSGVILVVVLLALAGMQTSTLAGPLAQATTAATSGAGGAAGTAAAGGAMTFPACPPSGGAAAATMAASPASTLGATMAATAGNATPGYLGVRVEQVANCGARVLEVVANGPAASSGLMVGDVIVAIDGKAITGVDDARMAVESRAPGTQIMLTVQRNGAEQTISVTLAARPAAVPATAAAGGAATLAATPAATAAR